MFLTHNFDLPALAIANLYRCRRQVEFFFKWIKQHLRITPLAARDAIRLGTRAMVVTAAVAAALYPPPPPRIIRGRTPDLPP